MNRLFLDTNIVLDYLLQRELFTALAQQLFAAGQMGRVSLQVSALTMATTHYLGRKPLGNEGILLALRALARQVNVVDTGAITIMSALADNAPYFEDAVQLYAALAAGADAIVTRDPRGFRDSPVLVLDPLAALRQL